MDALKVRKVEVTVVPGTMTKSCRSCGASIVWGKTASGRAGPADAIAAVDGKYFSHFETCAFATQHSKKEPKKAEQPTLV